jgi:hypothetical protein
MQPTPLRGPKIAAFLKAGFGPTDFPIYTAARLMGRPFGGTWHNKAKNHVTHKRHLR